MSSGDANTNPMSSPDPLAELDIDGAGVKTGESSRYANSFLVRMLEKTSHCTWQSGIFPTILNNKF